MSTDHAYAADAVATRLVELPNWTFVDGAIQRRFRTENWKATMMAVAAIGHLCEAAWHHPDLLVSYDTIVVRLSTHSAKGITDRDFALAAKIDAVIGWQPATEANALTGPPPRHAILHRTIPHHD